MKLEVIYEDKDLIAVNKPAGVLVHGIFDKYGPRHNEKTLADYILEKYPEVSKVGDKPDQRPGVIHRLDRETSGVILFARTQRAFGHYKELFKKQKVKKTYLALVWGRVKNKRGVIDRPISINNGTVKRTVHKGRMTREAITEYRVQKYLTSSAYSHELENSFTLLSVNPKTGRTHQIRVHLNSIGHPVYGDKLYGKKTDIFNLNRHFLHAQTLEIKSLAGKAISITAPLPKALRGLIKELS